MTLAALLLMLADCVERAASNKNEAAVPVAQARELTYDEKLIINTVGLKPPALAGDFDCPVLTYARLAGAFDNFSRRDGCANPPALAGGS